MSKFSPATKAVLESTARQVLADRRIYMGTIAAAVLRVVAIEWRRETEGAPSTEFISGIRNCIQALDDIAAELEGGR